MKRRWSRYIGLLVLALPQLLLVAFGPPVLATFTYFGMTVAGLLFVVAGFRKRIPLGSRTLRWYHLVGAADVLMALVLIGSSLHGLDGSVEERVAVGAAVTGGLSLSWIGVDIARGGKHFDVGEGEATG